MEEDMDVVVVHFTMAQIEESLAKEGIYRGTMAFVDEFDRRYRPSETNAKRFVEREDWVRHSPSPQFVEVMNGDCDPKQSPPRRERISAGEPYDVIS